MKSSFATSFCLITTLLAADVFARTVSDAGEQESNNNARFSIAIRGGASKGAYESGFNWSILKFGRGISGSHAIKGGRALQFDIVSISGASAGGINTLLSGLTWCSRSENNGGITNRIDDNIFRDIWLRADISTLLPKHADSAVYLNDDAVLSRRDFVGAASEIRDKWNKPLFRKDCRIPMGVTVTRIEPDTLTVGNVDVNNQRFYIPFELRVMENNTVDFYFNPADYPKLADPAMILMPRSKQEPAFFINDLDIENISFTTSAYPMAFGRKRLQYCRLLTRDATQTEQLQALPAEYDDLVCPDHYELTEAEFSDGGMFDNLPIGLARILAESNVSASDNVYPVTYLYINPNQVRYKTPVVDKGLACDGENPPEACRELTYDLASEGQMMLNAMSTARTYELYREFTSDYWQLNMSWISYSLSQILRANDKAIECEKDLPYFDRPLDCSEALKRAGQLLEIAYDRTRPVIEQPYSVLLLQEKGIVSDCRESKLSISGSIGSECRFNISRYRDQLGDAMKEIAVREGLMNNKIYFDIKKSHYSLHHDRSLRVSSRSAPITGTMMGSFASFLDYKFREYDYYSGIYDATVLTAGNLCNLHYAKTYQEEMFRSCLDLAVNKLYEIAGIQDDPRARHVFALLAQGEYGEKGLLRFSYEPMPAEDVDMRIIHDGLIRALAAGEDVKVFFEHLKTAGFVTTPGQDGKPSMLAQILDDPDNWASELTRRITNRLVYLETETEEIYEAREPDEDIRESANTKLIGTAGFVLQSATYRTHSTFSPSTAPDEWFWRNVIPFDMNFDIVEGDLTLGWQPTIALTKNDLIIVRPSLGFTGGFLSSSKDKNRENYIALGIGYTRKTPFLIASSYGITPTFYHKFHSPEVGSQNTLGGEVYINLLEDRLRIALGVRDFEEASDSIFLTVGINDIPGLVYWLTR